MYRDCGGEAKAPGAAIGAYELHEPSGVDVLPVRTLIARLVPAGVTLVHPMLCQVTIDMASNTRDSNAPDATYGGLIQSESTIMTPPPSRKSLAAIGRMFPVMAM